MGKKAKFSQDPGWKRSKGLYNRKRKLGVSELGKQEANFR